MTYVSLNKVRQCAVVPSGEKIIGQQSGEGISEEIKKWKEEQNLSSAERAKIEAEKKAKSEAWDKRQKEMYAQNLRELEEKKKDPFNEKFDYDDLASVVGGLDKYVKETSHLCFSSEEEYLLSILPNPKPRPSYLGPTLDERENSNDRFNWLVAKHIEWRKKQKLKTA